MPNVDFADERGTYNIGDLASLFGVSLRTLRFYEERGLLKPYRCGQLRIYSEDDRIRLEIILKARRLGFSLSAIADLIDSRMMMKEEDVPSDGAFALRLSKKEIDAQIAQLTRERASVVSAIEELRDAATRKGLLDEEPKAEARVGRHAVLRSKLA